MFALRGLRIAIFVKTFPISANNDVSVATSWLSAQWVIFTLGSLQNNGISTFKNTGTVRSTCRRDEAGVSRSRRVNGSHTPHPSAFIHIVILLFLFGCLFALCMSYLESVMACLGKRPRKVDKNKMIVMQEMIIGNVGVVHPWALATPY